MAIKYQNFDLSIERSGTGYLARVLESPAGEASIQFELPFSQVDVENLIVQISRSRLIESPEAKKIHSFGQELFEAIFKDEVRDRLRESLGEVNKQGLGLRVRLRMAGLSELGNFPWEFMYDPSLNRFLALSVDTPIVRYLEMPQALQPLTVQPPLRILAMICSPKDYPRLDVEREWQNLREAMQDLQSRGLVDIQRLEPPTLSALQQRLRREQFHIFHFVGHGMFSESQQDGLLLLEDEHREGYRLSGRDLGTLLHDHRPLRLAVLNACEGARTSSEDQFAGTAQSLMQQGIPAVIAMQFRITDQAAIILAHEFYGALADGYPVDAALTEARKAIKTQGNDLEWGTPVLYMRSPDGQIFDVAGQPATKRPFFVPAPDPKEAARVERVYTEALESFYLGKWEEAHSRLQEVVDSQPNHKDATAKLEIARRKMRLQVFEEQAAAAEKASDWDKAIEALEKLLAEELAFPEATSRLAKVRRQKQLADLYTEAQRLSQAEKWQAVLEIFREIDAIQSRNPDPQGLRASAEQNLTKAKKTKDIESAYSSALTALDASQWSDAIRHLRRVRGLQAGYRESESLLRRAESELERARKEVRKPIAEAREKKSIRAERLLFGLVFTILASRILAQLLGNFVQSAWPDSVSYPILITTIYMFPAGLFTGLALWWFLAKAVGTLRGREVVSLLLTCAIAETFFIDLGISLPAKDQMWMWAVIWIVIWTIIGIPIAMILRRSEPTFQKRQILILLAGWGIGYGIGVMVGFDLRESLIGLFGSEAGYDISVYTEQFLGSLIGGLVTLRLLKIRSGFQGISPEGLVLATAGGFALSQIVTEELFGEAVFDWIDTISNFYVALAVYRLVSGALLGVILCWLLGKLEIELTRLQARSIILGQAILNPAVMIPAQYWLSQGMTSWIWTIMVTAHGLGTGLLLAAVLRKTALLATRSRALMMVLGWTLAFFLGNYLSWGLGLWQVLKNNQISFLVEISAEVGLMGLIGGMFTIGLLKANRGFRINWKTVLAGALGFGFGNLLANIIVAPLEDSPVSAAIQMLVWGLIGGASLAIPSKNYMRYLLLGLLGGIGMALGYLASDALGVPDGNSKAILGFALGLFLGIGTRKISAAVILALIASMGYILRFILMSYYYPSDLSMAAPTEFTFLALTAGLMGAIIGSAWSFLNRVESITPENQNGK